MKRRASLRLAPWPLALVLLLAACGTAGDPQPDPTDVVEEELATYGQVRDHLEAVALDLETLSGRLLDDGDTFVALEAVASFPLGVADGTLPRGTYAYAYSEADGYSTWQRTAESAPAPHDLHVIGVPDWSEAPADVLVRWAETVDLAVGASELELPTHAVVALRDASADPIGELDVEAGWIAHEMCGSGPAAMLSSLRVEGLLGRLAVHVDFARTAATAEAGATTSLRVELGYGDYAAAVAADLDGDVYAFLEAFGGCMSVDEDALPTGASLALELERPSATESLALAISDLAWEDGEPTGLELAGEFAIDGATKATVAGSLWLEEDAEGVSYPEHDVTVTFHDADIGLERLLERLFPPVVY